MDDRRILLMQSKRHAQGVLKAIDVQGLHDPHVAVIPEIVKTPDGYGIQISRFDTQIMRQWQAYCRRNLDS